jgi:Sigma-70 region 3
MSKGGIGGATEAVGLIRLFTGISLSPFPRTTEYKQTRPNSATLIRLWQATNLPILDRLPAIGLINKLVRTSRQMLPEIGREPTPEELAAKLAMPLEKVQKLFAIAKQPVSLGPAIAEEDFHSR